MRPVLTAAALAAVLATSACAGEATAPAQEVPAASASSAAAPAASTPVEQDPASAPSSAPAEADLQTIALEVAGGRVTGDTGRVAVPLGSTFRLVVTSDVADEVHVHGYDRYVDLQPGQEVVAEIDATIPGVFEVELHDAGTLLTRIAVS